MINRRKKIRIVFKTQLAIALLLCFVSACQTFSGLTHKKSGTILTIAVKTDEPSAEQITELAVKVLQTRLNAIGADGEISKTTPNQIEAKIYDGADIQRIKEILLAESRFELRKAISPPSPAPLQTFPTKEAAVQSLESDSTTAASRKILPYASRASGDAKQWIIVENPPIVDGRELRDASAVSRTGTASDYQITFSLNPSGAQKFGDWTGRNIGNYVAVVLNDEVKSAAYIKSQIFDSGEISGRFTKQAAEDLALVMKSGYLPATFQVVEEKSFGK